MIISKIFLFLKRDFRKKFKIHTNWQINHAIVSLTAHTAERSLTFDDIEKFSSLNCNKKNTHINRMRERG